MVEELSTRLFCLKAIIIDSRWGSKYHTHIHTPTRTHTHTHTHAHHSFTHSVVCINSERITLQVIRIYFIHFGPVKEMF